jgi:serine/threonine protein phosphatase 1
VAVLTYAIGDIHGSYTKLANLLRHCSDHRGGNDARFVFLGDYVDRGLRSREAVSLLIETQAAAPDRITCLMGNHEQMLLNAANLEDELMWLSNGGDATLRSYGVERAADIPVNHLAWFEGLPPATSDDKRFFVHAGIMPGIPLDQQRESVMLWIREPFLSDQNDHGLYVVHGHTPTGSGFPELHHNRLNLDTYAWSGNPLVAAVFDERRVGPLAFITDGGSISIAPPINERERELYPQGNRARAR